MPNDPRLIGFAASSRSELFPSPSSRFVFVRPFPRNLLRPRAHPLSPSPLQSSFASSPRSTPFGASITCLGSWPSSRHHPNAATSSRQLPSPPLRSVPGFLSLSTVCSALGLAGLFHPAATSRVLPFRGFSPRAATLPLRKEVPPCRCSAAPSPTFAGCRALRISASRPSSARGRVRYNAVIHRAARRSPPRVRLLQALTSSVDRSLPAISAHDVGSFAPSLFAIARRARPQRLSRRSLASRLRFARLLEFSSLPPNLRARDSAPPQMPCDDPVRAAVTRHALQRSALWLPEHASIRLPASPRRPAEQHHACSIPAR
jgi:hypothetical protein